MLAIMRAFMNAQIWIYRKSNGRLGSMGGKVVLLTTTGRKSGKQRTVPLTGMRDGDRYLVAGSAGGDDRTPGWCYNVGANPAVTLQDKDRVMEMHAHIAGSDERPELWRRFVEFDQRFAKYAERTEREIPVVVIAP